MSVCWIKPGWCEHELIIDANQKDSDTMDFSLETTCPYINEMHKHFKEVNIQKEMSSRMVDTRTYQVASEYLPCVGCPAPSAILKSVEVLSGTCPEADTKMKFLHFDSRMPQALSSATSRGFQSGNRS